MQCPVDNETLVMTERSGVEIDYCPKCRGVWLDRGELDKIVERAAPAAAAPSRDYPDRRRDGHRGHGDDRDDGRRQGRDRGRRESFLSDLFDF